MGSIVLNENSEPAFSVVVPLAILGFTWFSCLGAHYAEDSRGGGGGGDGGGGGGGVSCVYACGPQRGSRLTLKVQQPSAGALVPSLCLPW